jgi:hypothetical protein
MSYEAICKKALTSVSGAQMELFDEKNQRSKISWQGSFKIGLFWCSKVKGTVPQKVLQNFAAICCMTQRSTVHYTPPALKVVLATLKNSKQTLVEFVWSYRLPVLILRSMFYLIIQSNIADSVRFAEFEWSYCKPCAIVLSDTVQCMAANSLILL